jgi:hypothetical protein
MPGGPVVFLVMSYRRPRQVERLVERLGETRAAVTAVHHDAKAAEVPQLALDGRARLVADPLRVEWGEVSLVRAVLHSMRWIRAEIPDFSWMVLISGEDYPAMAPAAIEAELQASQADVAIEWEYVPPFARRFNTDWQQGMARRYFRHRYPTTHRFTPVPIASRLVDGLGTFAGSTWWQMGRRAVDVVLADTPVNARLDRRFRNGFISDEAYFQMALLNAPLGLQIDNRNRRFVRFPKTGGSAHPDVLTEADIDEILASDAFFARKVGPESEALLERLDRIAPPAGFEPAT